MNEPLPDNDRAVIDELRALRQDLRTCFNRALWLFAASVVLVGFVFGKVKISSDAWQVIMTGAAVLAGLFLFGKLLQEFFNGRLRKRHEREAMAILSGRTRAPRRQS